MAEGFLGRWSRRKEAAREGKAIEAEPAAPKEVSALVPPPQPSPGGGGSSDSGGGSLAPSPPPQGEGRGGGTADQPPPPAPTLEDVQSLTQDSDFSRFVRPDVAPEVKNAAMKKLFADPHFNVMDRLDVYIDDYSQPDPIPPAMLRSLVSGKFLGLFDDEDEEKKKAAQATNAPTAREDADVPAAETVAQSAPAGEAVSPPAPSHADPDLRLQQDDAPGPEGPGQRPE